MALPVTETAAIIKEVEKEKEVKVSLNLTKFRTFQIELRVKMIATLHITIS